MQGMSYFSVKYTVTIGVGRFIPSVCYKLTQDIQFAVEKLAAQGLAKLYVEEVRFISGMPYPVKKPESVKPTVTAQSAGKSGKAGKQGKAEKRGGSTGARDFA